MYTDKEQDAIINRCDPDIINDLYEEMMLPEDLVIYRISPKVYIKTHG